MMCNLAIKREFCGLFRNIFKNCVKCSYEVQFAFIWQVAESAYADLISNIKFRGYLRQLWPQTSNVNSFSFKNHITIAFFV